MEIKSIRCGEKEERLLIKEQIKRLKKNEKASHSKLIREAINLTYGRKK